MKKTLILLSVLLVFILLVCGCEKSENESENTETNDKENASFVHNAETYSAYNFDEYITLGSFPKVSYDEETLEKYMQSDYEAFADEYKELKEITDRPVKDGDTLIIDYEGKKDGVAFEGGTAQGAELVIGSNSFIPGFEDGLIGKNLGETVNLDLTFPESYHSADLAGQAVVFTVTIQKITETIIPPIDSLPEEAFTKAGYESADEYKNEVRENSLKSLLWNNFMLSCQSKKLPEKEVNDYVSEIESYYKSMAEAYQLSFEQFIQYTAGSLEAFNGQVKEMAENTVKEEMVVYHLVETKNIKVSDEEYKTIGQAIAELAGAPSFEEYETSVGKDGVLMNIYKEKLVEC